MPSKNRLINVCSGCEGAHVLLQAKEERPLQRRGRGANDLVCLGSEALPNDVSRNESMHADVVVVHGRSKNT